MVTVVIKKWPTDVCEIR